MVEPVQSRPAGPLMPASRLAAIRPVPVNRSERPLVCRRQRALFELDARRLAHRPHRNPLTRIQWQFDRQDAPKRVAMVAGSSSGIHHEMCKSPTLSVTLNRLVRRAQPAKRH